MKRERGYRTVPRSREHITPTRPGFVDPGPTPFEPSYPPPSYAAQVWLTPDGLRLALPATTGDKGHSVLLPMRDASWGALLEILRARANYAQQHARATIGTRAAPIQYDLDAILKALGKRTAKVDHRTTLDDLGLDETGPTQHGAGEHA